MKAFANLELETKLLISAVVFFLLFWFLFNRIYEQGIDKIVSKGTNRDLISFLQEKANENHEANDILIKQMQWEVSAPFIVRTQKNNMRNILLLFTILLTLLAGFTTIYLTSPLKKLAKSIEKIGKGEFVVIETKSSGALGKLEQQVAKMQDELQVLRENEQIAATQKAWQDIARIMAHEIKNPLTPMRLTIDKISEKIATKDEMSEQDLKKYNERMNRQLNALEILVNKFRSFSKSQEAECSVQNLFSAISENADDFQNEIATKINGNNNISAFFDNNFLSQILLNIYKNSVNAGAKNMLISIKEDYKYINISLADDGIGLPKENLNKIFLPYTTFTAGGSGIGLSVVKNLCEKMGGECFAKSGKNGGFEIVLKLKREA
jgi:nitrogen fixation/metabolism regulation signal transduction histidine kinase